MFPLQFKAALLQLHPAFLHVQISLEAPFFHLQKALLHGPLGRQSLQEQIIQWVPHALPFPLLSQPMQGREARPGNNVLDPWWVCHVWLTETCEYTKATKKKCSKQSGMGMPCFLLLPVTRTTFYLPLSLQKKQSKTCQVHPEVYKQFLSLFLTSHTGHTMMLPAPAPYMVSTLTWIIISSLH